jgi:hypothetical protein
MINVSDGNCGEQQNTSCRCDMSPPNEFHSGEKSGRAEQAAVNNITRCMLDNYSCKCFYFIVLYLSYENSMNIFASGNTFCIITDEGFTAY